MTELSLAEPSLERFVGLGKLERVELEFGSAKVFGSGVVVEDGSCDGGAGFGGGCRSKGSGRASEDGEDGSGLHFDIILLVKLTEKEIKRMVQVSFS